MVWEVSHNGTFNCTKMTLLQNRNEAPLWLFSFISNLHQYDFSPKQYGIFIGRNVIMVLTFFFFEPYRGSRGLPLVFLDWLYVFPLGKIFRCGHLQAFLGAFFLVQRKKCCISKSLLAPIWRFSNTLQHWLSIQDSLKGLHWLEGGDRCHTRGVNDTPSSPGKSRFSSLKAKILVLGWWPNLKRSIIKQGA